METSLHRQLKEIYADGNARLEAPLDGFRIDVLCGDHAVEIQHGSLAAIRDKVSRLVRAYRVLLVKPLVVRKRIIKQAGRGQQVLDRRWSPKQGSVLDLFDELVYFTKVFPHPNLVLEVPLVDIEEWRYPGHGKRRRWRLDDHQVEDQKLLQIHRVHCFRTAADLLELLPLKLPKPFHTGQLAEQLGVSRRVAQRITYCLRETGAVTTAGKRGNTLLYRAPRLIPTWA